MTGTHSTTLGERLEQLERRPTRARNIAFALVVAFLALGAIGNSDYADAIDTWTEEKLARPARVIKADRAVIWSQRCERKGKQVLAKQADGGKWQISCVNAHLKNCTRAIGLGAAV